jgi:hypothetical protein
VSFVIWTRKQNFVLSLCSQKTSPRDHRTRRDRIERRERAFAAQMGALTSAFMSWSAVDNPAENPFHQVTGTLPVGEGSVNATVLDVFGEYKLTTSLIRSNVEAAAQTMVIVILPSDAFIASAFVRQGVIPCSPISPSLGFTTRTLELFRVSRLRNPHFSIQSFIKTLSDLHYVGLPTYFPELC